MIIEFFKGWKVKKAPLFKASEIELQEGKAAFELDVSAIFIWSTIWLEYEDEYDGRKLVMQGCW